MHWTYQQVDIFVCVLWLLFLFTALCSHSGCTIRVRSVSWPEVVKGVPNQGSVCFVWFCVLFLCFGCLYQCNQLPEKTHFQTDLLCGKTQLTQSLFYRPCDKLNSWCIFVCIWRACLNFHTSCMWPALKVKSFPQYCVQIVCCKCLQRFSISFSDNLLTKIDYREEGRQVDKTWVHDSQPFGW